jgi:hypothetical protein
MMQGQLGYLLYYYPFLIIYHFFFLACHNERASTLVPYNNCMHKMLHKQTSAHYPK